MSRNSKRDIKNVKQSQFETLFKNRDTTSANIYLDSFLYYPSQKIRRKDKVIRTDVPGDRTSITLARVNSMGDIQYITMDEEDHFHLPTQGAFIGNNAVYFFNQHKNYKKYTVGKSLKSILDF